MTEVAHVQVAPNWFEDCQLNSTELSLILGDNTGQQQLAIDQFNMLATYLVENVELHPYEIKDWLFSGMRRLEGKKPIDVLHKEGGFDQVFEEALRWYDDTQELI